MGSQERKTQKMMINKTFTKIFDGNTERYLLLTEITPEGKKKTTQPHGSFPVDLHLDPKQPNKIFGRSPVKYTNEGKGLCRWIGLDVDLKLEPKEACSKAWSVDTDIIPFRSTNGKWHYYKFLKDFIDVDRARLIKDKLVEQFNILGLKCDKDKCLPQGYNLKDKTPGNQLYLPRFYDGTIPYSPRGEPLTESQFLFRLDNLKHPLISGSVGLVSGTGDTGGRQKVLFTIALYLKHGDLPPEYLYEVNKNFTEPEADREVQHAISQSYKYDLKYLVDNYAKYTENLCGWPLPLDETLMNRIDTPGNEKIKKQYVAPEKASAVMGFHERIVYCKLEDMFWDKHTWTEYKERAINHTFQHEFKTKPSLIYGKNPDKLIVESTQFRPELYKPNEPIFEEDEKLYFNDYKPLGVEPLSPDKCELYKYYVEHLFLRNLENIFEDNEDTLPYFLDWASTIVKYPGVKIRQIPFICSATKQLGKGLFFQTMQKILHKDHVQKINVRNALDKGMTYLHRSLLVCIDEVYLKGDYKRMRILMDKFKLLATEQEHSIRTLYRDERQIWSNCNFIMFSNYPDAIDFDEKEQRYFYINSEAGRIEEPDTFYEDYYQDALVKGQLAECVKHFLLNRKILKYEDLTEDQKDGGKPLVPLFSPSGVAYKTEDFYERAREGGTESHQLCRRLVAELDNPFRYDVVSISEVHDYLKNNNKTYNESLNVLAEAFEDLKYRSLGRVLHSKSGKKPTLWIVRNQDEYSKIANTTIADKYWIPLSLEKFEMQEVDKRTNIKFISETIEPQPEQEEAPY